MTLERRLRVLSGCDQRQPMETAVKVAFATSDRRHIDQHFGAAEAFAIYAVGPDRAQLLEIVRFGRLERDGNEGKLEAKIRALGGCVAVYCQAIGSSAIHRLRAQGIRPFRLAPGTPLDQAIHNFQSELRHAPGRWLPRTTGAESRDQEDRFDVMEAEGWTE